MVPNFMFWNMIQEDARGGPQGLPVSCEFPQLTELSLDHLLSPLLVLSQALVPVSCSSLRRVVPPASSRVFILLTRCGACDKEVSEKGRCIPQKQTCAWAAYFFG